MKLIVYKAADSNMDHWLDLVLNGLPREPGKVVVTEVEDLTRQLAWSGGRTAVVLAAADSESELDKLRPAINLLLRHRLVIALGDDREEAVTKAHLFHPRLLVSHEDECGLAQKVLANIMKRPGSNRVTRDSRRQP